MCHPIPLTCHTFPMDVTPAQLMPSPHPPARRWWQRSTLAFMAKSLAFCFAENVHFSQKLRGGEANFFLGGQCRWSKAGNQNYNVQQFLVQVLSLDHRLPTPPNKGESADFFEVLCALIQDRLDVIADRSSVPVLFFFFCSPGSAARPSPMNCSPSQSQFLKWENFIGLSPMFLEIKTKSIGRRPKCGSFLTLFFQTAGCMLAIHRTTYLSQQPQELRRHLPCSRDLKAHRVSDFFFFFFSRDWNSPCRQHLWCLEVNFTTKTSLWDRTVSAVLYTSAFSGRSTLRPQQTANAGNPCCLTFLVRTTFEGRTGLSVQLNVTAKNLPGELFTYFWTNMCILLIAADIQSRQYWRSSRTCPVSGTFWHDGLIEINGARIFRRFSESVCTNLSWKSSSWQQQDYISEMTCIWSTKLVRLDIFEAC